MRNYAEEKEKRVAYIRKMLEDSHACGIVFGNSGGKDSALVGILCKAACDNTVGIIMPCRSRRNYSGDMDDAYSVADKFSIETRLIDLTKVRAALTDAVTDTAVEKLNDTALVNIAPRLRMTSLYAVAAAENRLVAGTGNRSERYMGYFTKWGDGAFDFNPISDLTVGEIYEFLAFLGAPENIIKKAPSAGLYEGQTDENDMGVKYASVDRYLLTGETDEASLKIIERYHNRSKHKRHMPSVYTETENYDNGKEKQ